MNFYKLFMNPKFMKFVGGNPSTIWMLRKIENLEALDRLLEIDLGSNQIEKIENLESLTNLTTLSLYYNLINTIEHLDALKNLQVLELRKNRIKMKRRSGGAGNLRCPADVPGAGWNAALFLPHISR